VEVQLGARLREDHERHLRRQGRPSGAGQPAQSEGAVDEVGHRQGTLSLQCRIPLPGLTPCDHLSRHSQIPVRGGLLSAPRVVVVYPHPLTPAQLATLRDLERGIHAQGWRLSLAADVA
jgi:hypothetical protein